MSYLKTKRIRYRRHFGPGCSRNKEKNKESESVNQKEFYWDKIVKLLVSSMLGLSFWYTDRSTPQSTYDEEDVIPT